MTKKNIDIQMTEVVSDVANQPILLENVLNNLGGYKKILERKNYEIKILDDGNNGDFVVGLVITEQLKDLPPKRNKETGDFSSLGLQDNEILAFGNIFLYDKNLKVIFYEVNGNGCYLDTFLDLIKEEWNNRQHGQANQIVEINLASIPQNGGLAQFRRMTYLKEFQFEITCPNAVLQECQDRGSSITSAINQDLRKAVNNNADIVSISYTTFGKTVNRQGLDSSKIRKLIKAGTFLLGSAQRPNVKTLKVVGYEPNPNGNGRTVKRTADLIADLLKGTINLPTVVQQSDLQEQSRRAEIVALHTELLPRLRSLLGA